MGTRLNPHLLILDILGTVLLAVGLAELVAGLALIPAPLRFTGAQWICVILGILLLLPLPVSLVKRAQQQR